MNANHLEAEPMNPQQAFRFAERCRHNLDHFDKRFPLALKRRLYDDFPKAFPDGHIIKTDRNILAWEEARRRTDLFARSHQALKDALDLSSLLADTGTKRPYADAVQLTSSAFRAWNTFASLLKESTGRQPTY